MTLLASAAVIFVTGCASNVSEDHFHVDPVVPGVASGPEGGVANAIHDAAVRSGRAVGWTDASERDAAGLKLSYAWRREAGPSSDRFRLVCHWRTPTGEGGEVTDGLAMPAHFWTESRAAEAAARLCAVTIGMVAHHGPRRAP